MDILVLGGTAFLGRWFVDIALARGHRLTLFNRGVTNPGLFPDVVHIHGDRKADLSGLAGRHWDAVFDPSGYVPRVVGMSANMLSGSAPSYLFVSSISAYAGFGMPDQDEDAPLASLEDANVEEVTGESYGGLKVLCEQVVTRVFGERGTVVRPGLIVGPHDPSDRFTYWPIRMERGGEVLVPDVKDQPVQIIDVRDLALCCVQLLENQVLGTFNATGPEQPYRMQDVLAACAAGTSSKLVWLSPSFLTTNEVQPWSQLPLALDFDGASNGLCQMNVSKAIGAGLQFRSLAETIADTREWARTRPADHVWKAGLDPHREEDLLRDWRESQPCP